MHGYMYILKCRDNSYYVGSTNDLTRRVEQHKNGEGAEYTKKRLPVELVYFEECFSIEEAYLREKQVQGWSRKKREALISGQYQKLPELSQRKTQVVSRASTTSIQAPVEVLETSANKEIKMFKIQTLNKISSIGLNNFPRDNYEVATDINNPDAILVRSAEMHDMALPESMKAVARAGAGTNNIPSAELAEKGIVVFNTPGANANAVKELVILSLLLSSRPVVAANKWVNTELAGKGDEIAALAEKGKSKFVGPELKGKTLGVIGLGAIGAMVANTAIALGMNVIGYDPFLSVKAALSLDHNVKIFETLDQIYAKSDYITVHVPQTDETKGMINANTIKIMKDGVRIINLARGGLVNNKDILAALESGKVAAHVTDFADENLMKCDKVICMPHLGASTPEAEDNCAVMAVKELRDFLETGVIVNSVNFPRVTTDSAIPAKGTRLCIAHKNVPNMIAQFTTILGNAKLNIAGIVDQSRGDIAYALIDVDGKVGDDAVKALEACDAVINVRAINA